jgi:sporulation protein YlmC with PRC-barrel domain
MSGGARHLDLCRQVLDHTLVDPDDMHCGTVDDIELAGGEGEPLRVEALLVGPGAWGPRLPALFARIARACCGTRITRVPWSEVAEVGEHIRLKSRGPVLGLGITDREVGLRIAKLPGSERQST